MVDQEIPVLNPDDLWMGDTSAVQNPSPPATPSIHPPEDFHQWQSHIGLKSFGEHLRAAAKAVFPRETPARYSKVFVLMLSWEDESLTSQVSLETRKLFNIFKDIYHFDVERWRIPSHGCEDEVTQKVAKFVHLGGDVDEHLKIVFYSGHSYLERSEKLMWTSAHDQKENSPAIDFSKLQSMLERASSDVLLLLDSSHASTNHITRGNSTTELIAASSGDLSPIDEKARSFASDLEIELRELSVLPDFSIGNLYHNIFCRNQSRMAEESKEYPTPIYLALTQEHPHSPRSIRLSARYAPEAIVNGTPTTEDSFEVQSPKPKHITSNGISSTPSFLHSSATTQGEIPRIAFAVRLKDTFKVGDLSSDLFLEWLRNLPASVADVKIEAGFHSHTSLLIVSIPICMSIYMPKDPAIINLGPITSFNQVLHRVTGLMPHGLPTPQPDSHGWDPYDRRPITPESPPKGKNGINGTHQTSEIRFRKQAQYFDSNGDRESRPLLNKGYSSQFSLSSTISEEPEPLKNINEDLPQVHINGNTSDPERQASHPIPAFGPHTSVPGGPQSKAHAKIKTYSDDPDIKKFPRISKPVELLRNQYDVVVIGSGYGGGVAASRMARAGQSVCLLERGKEKWPGEYPSGFLDAVKQLHVSGDLAPGFMKEIMVESGDPTGMYHLIVGKGQNAFVGNGLGGTSLLNANIFLEADEGTMGLECWPEELRRKDALTEYYKRAADVLQPESYPTDWPELPKLTMLERQAKALSWEDKFRRPRQTTRFIGGPNSTGVEMYPSALTGMDSTGVNDGSKSSTLVNYLSDAWNWGAEMFCECEVRYIKKHPDAEIGGYLVFFAWHGSRRDAFRENLYEDLMWVHAKKCVFLGAGAIGTTEILLRSKNLGLKMSDKVGTGMSGNGDILAFGYNCDTEVNAIGRQYPSPYKPVGPTITGIIDCREGHANPLDGFVIEEGAVPKALAPLFQTMLEMMPGNQVPKGQTLVDKFKHVIAQQGSRFLGPYYSKGSIERTQVYLIMSHDSNQAMLTLKNDKPLLEFLGVGRSEHVTYLNDVLRRATVAVGGTFVNSPFYEAGKQEITVHPIGGACMSKTGAGDHGVTNHFGEVFTGTGEETHHGLIVTDGSVIPTALGVNPFATITALAERSVEHVARCRIRRTIDLETKNDILNLSAEPHQYAEGSRVLRRKDTTRIAEAADIVAATQAAKKNGIGFSEVMSGYIHVGEGIEGEKIEDYATAAKIAKGLCEEARFFLSVKAWDTETIVNRPDHRAMLTGTFTCAGLKGSRFMVQRGNFHLFSIDQQAPGTRNLTYDFDMTSTDSKQYHFHGFKVVDSSVALGPIRLWNAASTLYVTISESYGEKKILGRGMMHIRPMSFISQLLTLQPSGKNFISKLASTFSFVSFFARQSASLFLAPFTWQQYPSPTYTGYINDTSPDRTIKIFDPVDKVQTYLHIFEPRAPGIPTKNLFMIPGASVDHQIFALPTIEVNAVNYFTRAGYRVFVSVHRICQLMVAENNWTTYDSRHDLKACLVWIRENYGSNPIYTIAHCMGSVAFSSGLLDGTIPSSWILGISCSQVFMNPIWATLNLVKASVGPIPFDKVYGMLAGNWFSCSSTRDDGWIQQGLNQVLRFYPDRREEICSCVSCHRCSLVFGRLWNHRNLNEATHRQINRFFSGVNMTLLHLLMQMGVRGVVTSNVPLLTDLTSPSNLRHLKGIPIFLFSGSDNRVLNPESTEKTYGILRDAFGEEGYGRWVVKGYGHLDCWMGREAWRDVYPGVREVVDRVTRGGDYRYREKDWKNDWEGWKGLEKSGDE